jgi:hypothetical protein
MYFSAGMVQLRLIGDEPNPPARNQTLPCCPVSQWIPEVSRTGFTSSGLDIAHFHHSADKSAAVRPSSLKPGGWMGEDSRANTEALFAVIKVNSKQRKNNPLRKQTGIDREFFGLCEVYSVKLAIKCFPFSEQVICWLRFPLPVPQSSDELLAIRLGYKRL